MIGSSLTDLCMMYEQIHGTKIFVTVLCRNEEKARLRFAEYLSRDTFTLLVQDVTEPLPEPLEFHAVIHAAANAHPKAFREQPVETMLANLTGTMHLLEHARKQKTVPSERFLYVSTGEIYGETSAESFKEDMPGIVDSMKVRSCYPESKRAAETLCVSYHMEYGLHTVVARPGYVYGPNFDQASSKADVEFFRRAKNGQDIVLKSDGSQLRSYCYSLDAALGIFTVLLRGTACEAYNISDQDGEITIKDLAEMIAEEGNVKVQFEMPPKSADISWSNMKKEVLDSQKILNLGFISKTSLKNGISKTLKILKELPII